MLSLIKLAFEDRYKPKVPASMFFRQEGWSVGEIGLDLILDEEHSQDVAVTEHPIQKGSPVADHVVAELREGSLRALVTNWSINHQTPDGGTPNNRAGEAWEALKALQLKGEPVTIVTALEVYRDVVITHLDTNRDGETGEALEIGIEFKQVKQVDLKETEVSVEVQPADMDSGINRMAALDVAKGQQVGVAPSASEAAALTGGTAP